MKNISSSDKPVYVDVQHFRAFTMVADYTRTKVVRYLIIGLLLLICGALLLPWTQNIRAKGSVIGRNPAQRPQVVQSLIAGKIEKWYIKEGDFVRTGDTLMIISEVKEKYIDPDLLERTRAQMDAKIQSAQSYAEKADALDDQSQTLVQVRDLKLSQARNYVEQAKLKVQADSLDLFAAESQLNIAQKQFKRTDELYQQGLKSLTEWEEKKQKLQEAQASRMGAESAFLSSKATLTNAYVELLAIDQEYREKILKTKSEQFGTMSGYYDADASIAKLENEFTNLKIRNGMYIITADQDGYVTRIMQQGVGGIVKEDEALLTIMPVDYELAVELYVTPTDLPLIQLGQEVQLFFDGIPSIVFSGWPNASYGVFTGNVTAIDQYIGDNGLYRIIIFPNEEQKVWPKQIRIGAGTQAYVLLNNVPAWYEAWRRLNGFPPNFYQPETKADKQ